MRGNSFKWDLFLVRMAVVIVTGTPGSGKTEVARFLSKTLGFVHVNVNRLIRSRNLWSSYDKKRRCYVVDKKKLVRMMLAEIKKHHDVIFDSHMSHYLPKKYVDVCIVTTCEIAELKTRLQRRRYSALKVRENLEAEIFQLCLTEAQEQKHKIISLDTTKGFDKKKLLRKVRSWIS